MRRAPARARGGALGLVVLLLALVAVFVLYGADLRRLLMPAPGSAAPRGPGAATTPADPGAGGGGAPAPTDPIGRARSLGSVVEQQSREAMRKAGAE